MASAQQQTQGFHVYAPSPTTGKLLVVEAAPVAGGRDGGELDLRVVEEVALGCPVATIARHPTEPVLYLGPASGEVGKAKGAVVSLRGNGLSEKYSEFVFRHPYAYLSLDRTHRFLFGVDYGSGAVDVYGLDPAGALGTRVAALDEGIRTAHSILTTPDNRFAYVTYVKDSNAIHQYRFDAGSGQLTALEPIDAHPPAGTGPRHMAYHPSLPIVYFSNEQHLGVSAYDIDAQSGALKLRQVCDAFGKEESKEGTSASDIVITPDTRFLFVGIRGHTRPVDGIARFRVKGENGELEFLGRTPADKIPWGFALSPDGRYLLVTAYDGATLTAFRIGSGGELTKAGGLSWEKNISAIVTR